MAVTQESGPEKNGTEENGRQLTRTQTRLMRRMFNGRSIPVIADDRALLTFKEASRYLCSLAPEARDAAYAEIKHQAKSPRRPAGE